MPTKTPSGPIRGDFGQFPFVVTSGGAGDKFGAETVSAPTTDGNSLEQGIIMSSRKNLVLMPGKHGIMRNQRPFPLTRVQRKSRWTSTARHIKNSQLKFTVFGMKATMVVRLLVQSGHTQVEVPHLMKVATGKHSL